MLEIMETRNNAISMLPEGASNELIGLTENIIESINDIKKNTVKIGYNLREIRDTKSFESAGFKNEVEYGETVFGFKKSAIYNFIKIADVMLDNNGGYLDSRYENYNPSQLLEMSSLPKDMIPSLINDGVIRPNMSASAIKDIVKKEKGKGKGEEAKKNNQKEKSDNQKKAAGKDEDTYVLKIGKNSLGNPYIKFMDNSENSEEKGEKTYSRINIDGLNDIITKFVEMLNLQANSIIEGNTQYEEDIRKYKEMASKLSKEELTELAKEL